MNHIEKKSLNVEYMKLDKSFKNVKESSSIIGEDPDNFVKSVVFDDNGKIVIAIILGNDRVNFDKLGDVTGSENISIAKPHEVMEVVGFPAGKVPPFGFNADFLIDSKVLEKREVYAGCGVEGCLMRISPNEIIRANDGEIADICD